MIGGFLGAGKTTTIAKLGEYLAGQGNRVGLITNDQANGLVDTAMLKSKGFATEEIAGGCFCCRFSSLTQAADNLTKSDQPDVFLAEPVGSCTDLVATVTYPLRRMYGEHYHLTPFTVLVDPIRASRVFGLMEGRKFSPKVEYIYKKQLQEAHAIVINKSDSVSGEELNKLKHELSLRYPSAELFTFSAKLGGTDFEKWMEWVINAPLVNTPAMDIDYKIYAEGEALLGWLNATVDIESEKNFDANELLINLSSSIQDLIKSRSGEIAHLKMTLSPHEGFHDVAIVNTVRNDIDPNLSQKIEEPIQSGELVINLRVEDSPDVLEEIVRQSLKSHNTDNLELNINHLEAFKPGKPVPEFREEYCP